MTDARRAKPGETTLILCHWAGERVDIATDHYKDFLVEHGESRGLGDVGANIGGASISYALLGKRVSVSDAELVALLTSIPWSRPERVLLIVQPPEGPSRVVRPPGIVD
jgi:hypothetical protein